MTTFPERFTMFLMQFGMKVTLICNNIWLQFVIKNRGIDLETLFLVEKCYLMTNNFQRVGRCNCW